MDLFLELLNRFLRAVCDAFPRISLENQLIEATREEASRTTHELDRRVDEEGRTQESGPTPTGDDSIPQFHFEGYEYQIGEESAETEPLLLFRKFQVGVWNRWNIPRCPGTFVLVYGCSGTEEVVWRNGFPYPDGDQQGRLWFHGTDYDSALSIIQKGIILHHGKGHQDFSHRDGFYLNPDFQNARRWACNVKRRRPAVIVFKLSLRPYKGLNLEFNKNNWEAIIKYNRSGREFPPAGSEGGEELSKLHDCDYMIGAINGGKDGPTSKERDWEHWTPSGFDSPFKQLCVRSEVMARNLADGKNIESVLFY